MFRLDMTSNKTYSPLLHVSIRYKRIGTLQSILISMAPLFDIILNFSSSFSLIHFCSASSEEKEEHIFIYRTRSHSTEKTAPWQQNLFVFGVFMKLLG